MAKTKELTQREWAAKGGRTTAEKYPSKAREWGKKGQDVIRERYGVDHYKKMRESRLKKHQPTEASPAPETPPAPPSLLSRLFGKK